MKVEVSTSEAKYIALAMAASANEAIKKGMVAMAKELLDLSNRFSEYAKEDP